MHRTGNSPRVAVVGSLNIDLIVQVPRLPAAGESILASEFFSRRGGKGANQALAAARQGAQVSLLGCVGDDEHGQAYRKFLRQQVVDISGVSVIKGERTGTALVAVDARGENSIIAAASANARLTAAAVRRHAPTIQSADLLLVQMETTLPALLEALRLARRAEMQTVFNPSPFQEGFPWGEVPIHTLVVNASEATQLFAAPIEEVGRRPLALFRQLRRWKIARLVVTRGAKATLVFEADGRFEVPTLRVAPVDTVGAGDAFAGTLAARLAEGASLREAVTYANCAGALATQARGAQEAIPSRLETNRACARLKRLAAA